MSYSPSNPALYPLFSIPLAPNISIPWCCPDSQVSNPKLMNSKEVS